jgi:heat shock protein HslJ
LSARIDCNRGRGKWEAEEPNQLVFGPMALTRAMCPPGSMHDKIAKDLAFVRSYVLTDGHLFLSLMATPAYTSSSQLRRSEGRRHVMSLKHTVAAHVPS